MKRYLLFTLFVAIIFSSARCFAGEGDPAGAPSAPKVREFAAFKAFFKKKGPITEQEVTTQFGPPDEHVPLYGGKEEPPSWWYYDVEKGERVGVAIDDHKVVLVTRNHRNKSVDVMRERSSLVKP